MTTETFSPSSAAVTGGYSLGDMTGTPWEGVLAVEGVPTGDGREFAPNALTWADTPLPLRWNIEDSHGGMPTTKTVLVGRIDQVWRNPENPLEIRGSGVFDDQGTNGGEALRLVQGAFLRGLSIDPDDISEADIEYVYPEGQDPEDDELLSLFGAMPELTRFHAGRIRATTLVDTPAFVEAQLWLTTNTVETGVTASAHFAAELSDRPWNGPSHERRLGGSLSAGHARLAFAHVHTGPDVQSSARFLHHEVADGGAIGAANLTACSSGIRTINAGRAATLSDGERRAAYTHLAEHLRAAGLTPPPYESGETLVASSYPDRPPSAWFMNPKFTELTPLTVTEDGHIFGHGAAWGTCHTGFSGECRTPPAEPGGAHTYFRLGEVLTAEGDRVAVGTITLGTGHASTQRITATQAVEHYDNTGTAIAYVATGEDEFGIWYSGAIRPGTSQTRINELKAAGQLSGDWRRIGGALRLVAFLAVNHPGFPVPRTSLFVSAGQQLSLVAAGMVPQSARAVHTGVGTQAALQRIAKSIGRDTESRLSELRTRVRGR